jgi:DNA-binding NarL/FixJ family response regulator
MAPTVDREEATMIRVFLASDDPDFSQSLCEYLVVQPDIQICGKAAISVEVAREASGLHADIAILELRSADDLEVVDCFKRSSPKIPLLLVAGHVSFEAEKQALSHGADAVFPKEDDPGALVQNVRAIYNVIAA